MHPLDQTHSHGRLTFNWATLECTVRRARGGFLSPDQETRYTEEYRYYPDIWEPPYIERRRKVGLGLYKLLGLVRKIRSA